MATAQKRMTAAELLRLPKNGRRYELVEGELQAMTPAGGRHGRIAARLTGSLQQYVAANGLGEVFAAETGFKLAENPDTVRAPDVAFVRRERVEAIGDSEGYWPGAPDLAVEVISPYDLYTEVEETVGAWLEAGARMVVVVNPRRQTVTVHRSRTQVHLLTESDTLDGADVVPGWRLPMATLFG